MQEKPQKNPSPLDLKSLIAAEIRQKGALTVAEYMSICLSHPKHGYYMKKDPLGIGGDFITSPEISQLFGELIGAWLVDAWLKMGKPREISVIELGPGRGTLSADIMRVIGAWPEFKKAMQLHLVETSPRLRSIQQKMLETWDVQWHENLNSLPEVPTLFVANEFFDALPIHQFERHGGNWMERRIDLDEDGKLKFVLASVEAALRLAMPKGVSDAPEGSFFELSPISLSVMEIIGRFLNQQGGAGLFIDYGHSEFGMGDTFQAMLHHQHVSVLEHPGDADLTAHVDFGTLKAMAEQQGCHTFPPITQGQFLNAMGIKTRAEVLLRKASERQREDIASSVDRLTHHDRMGDLFKVLAIISPETPFVPAGFEEHESSGH